MATRVLVTGAGGFIGHHLVNFLVNKGYWVRGADIKYPEFELSPSHEFELLDLRRLDNCLIATRDIDEVYHLFERRRSSGADAKRLVRQLERLGPSRGPRYSCSVTGRGSLASLFLRPTNERG